MDYPSIRGEDLPDYNKKATWNLLHACIDAHNLILIDDCPVDGVQAIPRLKYQCANMTFSDQSRYDRMVQQVVNKGGESAIKYIKIFQNAKALVIPVGNSYTEEQMMHNLLGIFQQG